MNAQDNLGADPECAGTNHPEPDAAVPPESGETAPPAKEASRSDKWKDRLSILGMLVVIGFAFHIVAIIAGVVVDIIIGLVAGGDFNWPVTKWMFRWWR